MVSSTLNHKVLKLINLFKDKFDSLLIVTNLIDASRVLQRPAKQNFSVVTAVCDLALTHDSVKRSGMPADNVHSASDKDELTLAKNLMISQKSIIKVSRITFVLLYPKYYSLMTSVDGLKIVLHYQ